LQNKKLILFFSFLIIAVLSASLFIVQAQTINNITVTTDMTNYYSKAPITISARATSNGAPITNALVAVGVKNPNGDIIITRTVGQQANTISVDIDSAFTCDGNGIQINNLNVNAGSQTPAYFSVTIRNREYNPHNAVVSLSVFDSKNVLIDSPGFSLQLQDRASSTWITSVYIPSNAAAGVATAYVTVLSNKISSGGTPYCREVPIQFTINGQQNQPAQSENTANGWYNLTFTLPTEPKGNYAAYTSSANGGPSAATAFIFTYFGDFNGDYAVTSKDVTAFVDAYVGLNYYGTYNMRADFNRDGLITSADVTGFVDSYNAYGAGQ
jgi:hypothetical protein